MANDDDGERPAMDGKHFNFNEGLATRPDVDLLVKSWPNLQVGDRIDYEEIENLIGVPCRSSRFKTVTYAWRHRMLEDHSIVIEAQRGELFYVSSADQITAGGHGTLSSIVRKAKKQRKKLSVAKVENDTQRQTIEHQARLMLAVEKDARKYRMNLLPNTATNQLPGPRPEES